MKWATALSKEQRDGRTDRQVEQRPLLRNQRSRRGIEAKVAADDGQADHRGLREAQGQDGQSLREVEDEQHAVPPVQAAGLPCVNRYGCLVHLGRGSRHWNLRAGLRGGLNVHGLSTITWAQVLTNHLHRPYSPSYLRQRATKRATGSLAEQVLGVAPPPPRIRQGRPSAASASTRCRHMPLDRSPANASPTRLRSDLGRRVRRAGQLDDRIPQAPPLAGRESGPGDPVETDGAVDPGRACHSSSLPPVRQRAR